jgi:hypothetical protein
MRTLKFKSEPKNGRVLVLDGDEPLGYVSARNLREYLWALSNEQLEEAIALKMRETPAKTYAAALREVCTKNPRLWREHRLADGTRVN